MGKKLIFLVYIFSVLILFVNPFNTHCSTINELNWVESTDKTFDNCFHKSENMFEDMPVGNFDISDSGKLLLCLQHNCINIYDNQGNFEFSLNYNEIDGSSIAFWYGDDIVIYLFRANTFILIDNNCNVKKVYEFTEDDSSIINTFRNKKEIIYKEISYNLSGIKKLTRTDSEGEKIIYTYHSNASIIIIIVLIGISVIIIEFITKKCK